MEAGGEEDEEEVEGGVEEEGEGAEFEGGEDDDCGEMEVDG